MRPILALPLLLAAAGSMAQDARVGRVANTANGQAGQRSAESARVVSRVDGRIQNRVQSRVRNRIDRNYSPQVNASDPFAVADDQLRAGSRPRR